MRYGIKHQIRSHIHYEQERVGTRDLCLSKQSLVTRQFTQLPHSQCGKPWNRPRYMRKKEPTRN